MNLQQALIVDYLGIRAWNVYNWPDDMISFFIGSTHLTQATCIIEVWPDGKVKIRTSLGGGFWPVTLEEAKVFVVGRTEKGLVSHG